MENTINQRIDALIKQMRTNPKVFAESIGKTSTTIYTVINGRNKPGYDVLEGILKKYPEVNPDWLLTGDGGMYRTDKPASKTNHDVQPDNYLHDHLKHLEESFTRLSHQLEKKDEQIAGLQRTVDVLLGKSKGVSSSRIAGPFSVIHRCDLGQTFQKLTA